MYHLQCVIQIKNIHHTESHLDRGVSQLPADLNCYLSHLWLQILIQLETSELKSTVGKESMSGLIMGFPTDFKWTNELISVNTVFESDQNHLRMWFGSVLEKLDFMLVFLLHPLLEIESTSIQI